MVNINYLGLVHRRNLVRVLLPAGTEQGAQAEHMGLIYHRPLRLCTGPWSVYKKAQHLPSAQRIE